MCTVIVYTFTPSLVHECPSRCHLKEEVTRTVGMIAVAHLSISTSREKVERGMYTLYARHLTKKLGATVKQLGHFHLSFLHKSLIEVYLIEV